MKLIDAAIKDLNMIGDCRTCGNKNPFCDSNLDSCRGYECRGAPPGSEVDENSPLTLEQLRWMDGEPVWCDFLDSWGRYMIIQWHNSEFFNSFECGFLLADEYGKSWLAYRRRPEEAHKS